MMIIDQHRSCNDIPKSCTYFHAHQLWRHPSKEPISCGHLIIAFHNHENRESKDDRDHNKQERSQTQPAKRSITRRRLTSSRGSRGEAISVVFCRLTG